MADYVRLRAPKDHGQTLQLPPLDDGTGMVQSNQSVLSGYPGELNSIRAIARQELPDLALRYSRQYSDVSAPANTTAIVMAGHQPTLFHPGVWFKNVALDQLRRSCDAMAINIIVDNDLCDDTSVLCPKLDSDGTARQIRVPYDEGTVGVPFEVRSLIDREMFDTFGQRLGASICDMVESPLIESLWPEVINASSHLNLPASIAAGRHRLEQNYGIENLELPVSLISTSQSFAMFVERLVCDAERFAEVYNAALKQYRSTHGIRSRSHPVPELEAEGRWQETPFWIWTTQAPNRRRLFVCCDGGSIALTDRGEWSVTLRQNDFANSFQELNQIGGDVCIRPRALATTMFSRLFASDLFLHGIGGAKYDQLNDEIMRQFFNVAVPEFMTMTATMKLPFDFDHVGQRDVTDLEVQLRQLRYHPELHVEDNDAANRKARLLECMPKSGSRKSWHDEIAAINESLFQSLQAQRQRLEQKIARTKAAIPTSRILGSREYSFALFPENLMEQLQGLSGGR